MFTPHPGERIDMGYVIGRAWHLVFQRPKEVFIVAIAAVVVQIGVFVLAAQFLIDSALARSVGIESALAPAATLLMLVVGVAASMLVQAPLVGSAIEVHTDRRDLFRLFGQRGMASLGTIIGATMLVLIITVLVELAALGLEIGVLKLGAKVPWEFVSVIVQAVGTFLVIYYALRVYASFLLVTPIVVVERTDVIETIRRSLQLGWRNGAAIVLALVLPLIIAQLVLFPTQFMPMWVGVSLGVVLGLGLALYNTAVAPVAYVAIREYVDGIHPGRLLGIAKRRQAD